MNSLLLNRYEFFNDICVFLVTQHFLLFTDIIPEYEDQYRIGWSCVGITALCITINMSKVLYNILHFIYLVIKKFCKRAEKKLEPHVEKYKAILQERRAKL